jgi:SAM-dependent methyltransferase
MPDVEYFLKLIKKHKIPAQEFIFKKKINTQINSSKLYRKNFFGSEMLFHVEKILNNKNKIVLDLCSGNGENEDIFYELGAKEVILTDYRSDNAHVLIDVHNLPFKPNTFDLIFCSQAMEHWYDPYEALRQINLILKPGGSFICSVSFMERWHGNSFFHCSPHAIFSLCHNNNLSIEDFWLGGEPINDFLRSRTIFKFKKINSLLLNLSDYIFRLIKGEDVLLRNKILSSKSYSFVAVKKEIESYDSKKNLFNRSM